jgi:hypothetical protein
MINIILFLLGIILGVITICAILIPKIKQTQKLDNEIFEKNE